MLHRLEAAVPWYATTWFRRLCIASFWLLVAVKVVQSIFFKDNDFAWHLDLGRTALAGTPYLKVDRGVFGTHYAPGRVLIDSFFALFPYRLIRVIIYAAAMGALLVTSRCWRDLADAMKPASQQLHMAAAFTAFVLLAPWVVQDFDECGLQIILLFFLSMAGWLDMARPADCGWSVAGPGNHLEECSLDLPAAPVVEEALDRGGNNYRLRDTV